MARRYDPERRERIIDAAIRIVELKGIGALSHRSVAAEAGVPLGSTTYHFAGLDDLLVASLERVCSGPRSVMSGWGAALAAQVPLSGAHGDGEEVPEQRTRMLLADALTGLLEEYAQGGRGRMRLEYELYLAALRRPALQPVAAAWLDEMVGMVGRHTADVATARVLVALIDGMLLQLLLTDRPFDRQAVRSAFACVTGGA